MLSLPVAPETQNIRALAAWRQEEVTGLVTATITLQQQIDAASGICLVWKNGTLVQPSTITIAGNTLTLGSALIAGDWVVIFYKARGTP